MSLKSVTKSLTGRENKPITFRIPTGRKHKLKVTMGAFGAKMRNSDFYN